MQRAIDSCENFYTSNILTSLENKDAFLPPRFDFQGHKKETKHNPPTTPSTFSVSILEPPIGSRHPGGVPNTDIEVYKESH